MFLPFLDPFKRRTLNAVWTTAILRPGFRYAIIRPVCLMRSLVPGRQRAIKSIVGVKTVRLYMLIRERAIGRETGGTENVQREQGAAGFTACAITGLKIIA
jgi:hypothetical protein